jgi:transcription elongation factor Elf1
MLVAVAMHTDIVLTSAIALLAKVPTCLLCGRRMSIVSVVRVHLHMSQRTFACPSCDREKDDLLSVVIDEPPGKHAGDDN